MFWGVRGNVWELCANQDGKLCLCGDRPSAEEIMDGWWPDANEQREKVVKPQRDRFLPVTTLHPDGCYEWALDKPRLTTLLMMFGPGFASHGGDLHNIGGAHRVNGGGGACNVIGKQLLS